MAKKRRIKNLYKDGRGYWKPDAKARKLLKSGEEKINAHYKKEESNG